MYRGGGGGGKKKIKKFRYEKKEFQSALCMPLGRWTGNNFLFKGGLMGTSRELLLIPKTFIKHVLSLYGL